MRITEYDVDDAVERGTTAEALLNEHCPTAARGFKRHIAALNKLLAQVRRVFPDANYYLEEDHMNLMLGASHEGDGGIESRRQHRSAISVSLWDSGGGGW